MVRAAAGPRLRGAWREIAWPIHHGDTEKAKGERPCYSTVRRSTTHDADRDARPVRRHPGHRLLGGTDLVRTAAGLPAHLLPTRHRGRVGACGASLRVHCAAA